MTLPICGYVKTKKHNTNYYRRNKLQRFNVKCCPHCSYETTGPKSALQAHIWSKHTPENERPFQCPCGSCEKGFSARANLNKHILKKHKITMPKKIDKDVLIYKIDIKSNNAPEVYINNHYIIAKNLPYTVNNKTISFDSLFYDKGRGLINITPYTKEDMLKQVNNRV